MIIVGRKKKKGSQTGFKDGSSTSSKISTDSMKLILEKLKSESKRESTSIIYQSVWRKFNRFVIQLDYRPKEWEERASLFRVHLVECCKVQSSTLRLYMSAIKRTLKDDGYEWDDNKLLLSTLTQACKIKNDHIRTRLPINIGLLETLIFEMQRKFHNQPYLEILYRAFFLISYYGLFRIGELTLSKHVIKAKDVHIAMNKDKMLFVLYSSKTHSKGSRPQKVKITACNNQNSEANKGRMLLHKRNFCPFQGSREYMAIRGNYPPNDNDPFFVYADNQPVKPEHARKVLKGLLKDLNLNPDLYRHHSLRIGHSSDCTVPFMVQPFAYTSCTSRLRASQGSHRMGDQWHQL